MQIIKSLTGVSFTDIAEVFNQAFSDYYFPIHFTAEQFESKFASENGVFELSVGAYDDDVLVGFILHYYDEIEDKKVIYNGGTGVIPTHRGKGLTRTMYNYILPILRERKIDRMVHEVLSVNDPAIAVYEQVGFKQVRSLDCYKGELTMTHKPSKYVIKEIQAYDWDTMQSFWDYQPTWQNSILAIDYLKDNNVCLGIYSKDDLLGYIIYKPDGHRINQIAIHKDHRNNGLGRQLLYEIANRSQGNDVVIINVDSRLVHLKSLFEKYGMNRFIEQYELAMDL